MLLYTRHRIFGPGLATTALVLVTGLLTHPGRLTLEGLG